MPYTVKCRRSGVPPYYRDKGSSKFPFRLFSEQDLTVNARELFGIGVVCRAVDVDGN